ncbi:GntR family transcriptional regulator YhfZ [Testudinibacter sp. P80/BLE/0925]|uniref:GntR family transcriptional regulator YhfZ n=1 Tax=Testudinibacter sp. TW-1 TaxID=3417757 RepID=UPI003D3697EB
MIDTDFIKKDYIALFQLAQYFLNIEQGQRIETISRLSEQFGISVGVIQKALKTLESNQFIYLERKGCQGSYLKNINPHQLVTLLNISSLVCVMPLPYTKLYEGLASGLKLQFENIPLYFAHMRGAEARLECLYNGIYDLAVSSHLACEHWLEQGKLEILMRLGAGSYVQEHGLICRDEPENTLKKIGVDIRSPDQLKLTEWYFAGQAIEIVPITYNNSFSLLKNHIIDGVIWNIGDRNDFKKHHLTFKPLKNNELFNRATEAVILIKKGNEKIKQLFHLYADRETILQHQQLVVNEKIEPSY